MEKGLKNRTNKQALKKKIKNTYAKIIYPEIKHLEKTRIKYLATAIAISLITVIIFLIFIFYWFYGWISVVRELEIYKSWLTGICMTILFGIVPFSIVCGAFSFANSQYAKKIKDYKYLLAKSIGLKYGIFDRKNEILNIKNSMLFQSATKIDDDDIFMGEFNGVNLKIIETKILNYVSSKDQYTLFKGVIVTFQSNKDVPCTTLIRPKFDSSTKTKSLSLLRGSLFLIIPLLLSVFFNEYRRAIFDISAIIILFLFYFVVWRKQELEEQVGLQKMKLEDIEFSKHYDAYSYSQVEGRYLLTTAFIKRFMDVSKAFKNCNIKCSYVDNCLVLAIPSQKNIFEISNLFVSLKDPRCIDQFVDEIVSILLLVDYFKLDTNTKL